MNFLPLGFQYYRAPTPEKCFWKQDLTKMKAEGFNTVKFWVQWRWSERKEGVFDFSDLDELMDLSDKLQLKVVLNFILDVAPVWFIKKYPDSFFVSLNGEQHKPMAINCRQIGGVPGPCVHHEKGNFYRARFVEETVKHFKNHPSLLYYDVWNEPNLNFKADRKDFGTIICYCENSIREFKIWLKEKYKTVDRLNEVWGKCYNDFDEVEPPRCTGMSNEFIDWRLFFVDSTTKDLKMRIDAVKKHDTEHKVMCHTVPYPIFSGVFNTTDDFALAAECDLFGNSVGSNAFAANMLVDSARGKDVINAEVHMVGGHAITGYIEPNCEDIQKHYLIPLSRGIKGFLIWQYRPESLGDEAPCWGNIDYLGNNQKWQKDCIVLSNILKKYENIVLNQNSKKPNVAIYFDPKSEAFTYSMTDGSTELFDNAVQGLYNYLYDCNKEIRFIREKDIQDDKLDYDVIYFPGTYCFNSKLTKTIEKYVVNGGTVILEPLAAMHDENTGKHSPVLPGCGLHELAGVMQTSCYHQDKLEEGEFSDPVQKLFNVKTNENIYKGKFFRAYYKASGNNVKKIAGFDSGETAIWENSYGKGKVITLGTSLSSAYPAKENYAFFQKLGQTETWKQAAPIGVRADIIAYQNEGLLVIDNRSQSEYIFNKKQFEKNISMIYSIKDGNLTEEIIDDTTNVPAGSVRLFYVKSVKDFKL